MEDLELLQEFIRTRSDTAFTELVRRHVDLVYSAAFRLVHEEQIAKDIVQSVFICLARKAASVPESRALAGWLYRAALYEAASALRAERRRLERETNAVKFSESEADTASVWSTVAPLLEEAMGKLGRVEQDAVVLRFFENKSLVEIGAKLGLSEEAARKRVNRALEKLRNHFARRGVTPSCGAIAACVATQAVRAAPAGAVEGLVTASMAAATTSGASGWLSALARVLLMHRQTAVAAMALLALGAAVTGLLRQRPAADQPAGKSWPTGSMDKYSGEVRFRTFEADGTVKIDDRSAFTCTVDGSRWSIRLTPIARKKGPPDYHEFLSDGATIYGLTCFKSAFPGADRIQPDEGNIATATVQRRKVPHSLDGHEVGMVWMAFASAPYFDALTNAMAEPPGSLGIRRSEDYDAGTFEFYRIQLRKAPSRSAVPDWLAYFCPGELSHPEPIFPELASRRPGPYDGPCTYGETNCVFVVEERAREGTHSYVRRARLCTYGRLRPRVTKLPVELWLKYEYVLETTNHATERALPAFPPLLPGSTAVEDWRLVTAQTPRPRPVMQYNIKGRHLTDEEVLARTDVRWPEVPIPKPPAGLLVP